MPYRKTILVSGEIYHAFNRSIAKQPIFIDHQDHKRAIDLINFYRFGTLRVRFSHYKRIESSKRASFLEGLISNVNSVVEIFAFCIMPNHVHFLLRQNSDKGLSIFMRNFQHSYSKYFNTKNKRTGSVFQSMFKAVRIETDEQLLHVSRYIHLNPSTAMITPISKLEEFPWSSFTNYQNDNVGFINKELILASFTSKNDYKQFVLDQADYQKELNKIKHLTLE